jgi:hypothetical protein
MRPFDVDDIRAQFPALNRTVNGRPAAFLDGPVALRCRSGWPTRSPTTCFTIVAPACPA